MHSNSKSTLLIALAGCLLASCKVGDPFVDRDVAPLLVDVVGAEWASPIATVPSVTYDSSAQQIVLSVRLLRLDKTNLLDYTKGIDSIPAANIPVTVAFSLTKEVKAEALPAYDFVEELFSNSGSLGTFTSDADGLVSITKSYADFGLEGNRMQRKDDKVSLTWSGAYEGKPFTRLSQLSVSDN